MRKVTDGISVQEKIYKTMRMAGISSLVFGIILVIVGLVTGVMSIINGVRLLIGKSKIVF